MIRTYSRLLLRVSHPLKYRRASSLELPASTYSLAFKIKIIKAIDISPVGFAIDLVLNPCNRTEEDFSQNPYYSRTCIYCYPPNKVAHHVCIFHFLL